MDEHSSAGLYANLRELLAIDHDLGVQMISRPARADTAPAERAAARPAPAPSGRGHPASAPATPAQRPTSLPPGSDAHLADLPTTGPAGERLARIAERIATCDRCPLCTGRTHTVPGEGEEQPQIMFIGEGPGADEDRQGRPFVGAAGRLLDKMIAAMGLRRDEVFIANIIKCRPPGNRTPEPAEMAACLPYLERQVDALQPAVICTLGNVPLRALTGDLRRGITRARGTRFTWRGITCLATFHPSYLLRNPAGKKPAWEDLQQVLRLIGREPPARGG
ncbi:MAG: uracil-DNA glycosylase [Planctomycetota bacterium]